MTIPLIVNGVDCSTGRAGVAYGWRKVRGIYIKDHPFCAACGYTHPKLKGLDVHHIIPRHVAPQLALEMFNFITLCRKNKCHIRIGHFSNYRKYWNPDIIADLGDRGKILMLHERDFKENLEQQLEKWRKVA